MSTPSLFNSLMDRLILPGALGFTRFGYECRKRNWTAADISMEGQTVVITGATSGLGLSTAHSLAKFGARIVMVGRDPKKAKSAQAEVAAASGDHNISVQLADLSLMSDVRELAARLLDAEDAIHVLINNAAILPPERKLTVEGLEQTFATDLLSPYLLTELLLPRLRASAPARIINVLSGGMYLSGLAVDDLEYERGDFDGSRAYARAKRALMVLTVQWAEELAGCGIAVNAMHPGWADTPGVEDSLPGFHSLMRAFLRTPEQGADTIVWLASDPAAQEFSGGFYFDREPHVTTVFPFTGGDADQRRELRAKLEEYCERSRV